MVGRWFVGAVLLLRFATNAHAGEQPDLQASLAKAKAENKAVLVEFTADWCKPCEKFNKKVLTEPRVRYALRDVVFLACDVETDSGREIQERYNAKSLPTFLVLDSDGAVLDRKKGYQTKLDFLALVERATWLASPEPKLDADETSAKTLDRSAEWYMARGGNEQAIELLERAAAADADNQLGIGADAAWKATALRAGIDRRKTAIVQAIEHVESYPGSKSATQAIARAVLSGELSATRVEELLNIHLDALNGDAKVLHYLLYVAVAAEAPKLAVRAAIKLEPLAQEGKHYFAIAEAFHHAGLRDEAMERAATCATKVQTRSEARSCEGLLQRILSRDMYSRGAIYVQRDIDSYFINLEVPDRSGDDERQRIASEASEAKMGEERAREFDRYMEFMTRLRKAMTNAGRECAKQRGRLKQAWVRLKLHRPGGTPTRVTVLEPDAGDSLRRCLRETLGNEQLPAAPSFMKNLYVGSVRFDDKVHKKDPGEPLGLPRDRLRREWLLAGRHGHGLYEDTSILGRLFLPLSKKLTDVRPALMIDGEVGRASGGTAYAAHLMIGAATSAHPARLGLFIGGGASRAGNAVPFAWQLPLELSLSIQSKTVRMRAWGRITWTTGDERQAGAENAPATADELSLGIGFQLPATTKRGLFFGLYYQEFMGDSVGGIMLGTGSARFY